MRSRVPPTLVCTTMRMVWFSRPALGRVCPISTSYLSAFSTSGVNGGWMAVAQVPTHRSDESASMAAGEQPEHATVAMMKPSKLRMRTFRLGVVVRRAARLDARFPGPTCAPAVARNRTGGRSDFSERGDHPLPAEGPERVRAVRRVLVGVDG